MIKNIKFLLIFLLSSLSFVFSQDAPGDFEYNQSRYQAFYLFLNGDIDGVSLDDGDWIGAFNDDVCVLNVQDLIIIDFFPLPINHTHPHYQPFALLILVFVRYQPS